MCQTLFKKKLKPPFLPIPGSQSGPDRLSSIAIFGAEASKPSKNGMGTGKAGMGRTREGEDERLGGQKTGRIKDGEGWER